MELTAGYKQTQVGVIPADWDDKRLGDVGDALIGLTYKPTDVGEYGTLVLRSSNIQNNVLVFDDNIFVNCTVPDPIMVRPGDVLICVRNGSRELIGKTVYLDERAQGMTFGAFMAVHRGRLGKLVSYLFQSEILKRQIREHLGATINQITNKSINSFLIPVPSTEDEQRAITTALCDIDALLGALDRLIAKKRDVKQAAMQQLLTGHTRLSGFSGEWEAKRLKDVAELNRLNIAPAEDPNQLFTHFSLPAFDADRVAPVEPGMAIGSNKFRVPQGAVLVSKLNPRIPRVWMPENIPENAIASTEWLILTPKDGTDRRFLHVLCSSPAFCERMELGATGTTGSHQRISPSTALGIVVRAPAGRSEQTAIATVLSDMDAEIAVLEVRRAKTRDLKQAMMQELLTGRTRLM